MGKQNELKEMENQANKTLIKACGLSDDDLRRPFIGIANAWSEIVPGHTNLRFLADYVKRGAYRAGGSPVEFGTIGVCDGVAGSWAQSSFILPTRDIIADSIEMMARNSRFDGLVMLGSCDKIIPGMLMAASRLDIPSIILVGGPMLGGPEFDGRKADASSGKEALGMYMNGRITKEELETVCDTSCPTCGSCQFMGTANTMCSVAEVMGMSLPGSALIPAVYLERQRAAFRTGEAIVNLVNQGIRRKDILNFKSIQNAISFLMTAGGSTNAILHMAAIGNELGIDPGGVLEEFNKQTDTIPQLVRVNPSSKYNMEDLYASGGIPQVLKELSSLIHMDCMTVTGKTIAENVGEYRNPFANIDRNIVRPIEEPFEKTGGLCVLKGNLAPNTAISKPSGIAESAKQFTGTAVVFDSQADCIKAIEDGNVKEGCVVVIRYVGPKGGLGMPEMYKPMKLLYGLGLAEKAALVTDGRFSGTNNGCFVGHVSPEAAEGGPIAVVENGDTITIDVINKKLHLHVSDEEIAERLKNWSYSPKEMTGYMKRYVKLAQSADKGAVLKVP